MKSVADLKVILTAVREMGYQKLFYNGELALSGGALAEEVFPSVEEP